jgi:prepilin peptidase CpaA
VFPVDNPNLWFLILTAPFCFTAAWTDLRFMRIKNHTVYFLLGIFVVFGIFILPFSEFAWRLLNGVIAFVIVLMLNNLGKMGAGDAKFISVAVPYITPSTADFSLTLYLISAGFLSGLAVHSIAKRTPAIRNMVPNWRSFKRNKFPGGLTLGGTLFFYLLVTAWLRSIGVL